MVPAALAPAAVNAPAGGYVPNEIIVKFRGTAADSLQEQLPFADSAKGLSFSPDLDRLNAKYRVGKIRPLCRNFRKRRAQLNELQTKSEALLGKRQRHILRRLRRAPQAAHVPDLGGICRIQFDLQSGQSIHEVIGAYQNSPDVEYAELNYIVSISAEPNDPLFPVQWPLRNIAQMYPASGKFNQPPGKFDVDIDAPQAWDIATGTSGIIVAVIDTGIDYTHRDLDDNMWVNEAELNGAPGVDDDENGVADDVYGYDFINGDPNPRDDHGHGTHCAGIIAAEGNNGLDIAGVCWDARIMAVKFLGSDGHGDLADAVEAVYYAVDSGADVLSNSWVGFTLDIKSLEEAFDYAYSQGVIAVTAAGNSASTDLLLPAYFENVISVAATDSRDSKPFFSNYGEEVEIAAPGVDVLSLRAAGTSEGTVHDNYTTILSGTSMACPHVSGAFALILSLHPGLNIEQAWDILMQTTDQINPEICASGRLNLHQAIRVVASFYAGIIRLDKYLYTCSDAVQIRLEDLNLVGQGTHSVTVTTSGGDSETVTLVETGTSTGIFAGAIAADAGDPVIEDGTLQLAHGELIIATYEDQDDGTGNPATVTDSAIADCEPPTIYDIRIDPRGPEPVVTFATSEPTMASVLCGPACGGPYIIESNSPEPETTHVIKLIGVSPETDYFFIVRARDIAGNETTDDNAGVCYPFTTTGPSDMYVPGQHLTIQEAIEKAWDGSVVWVADRTYTGEGNRDIDFKGRAITVRSENGPEKCIVDCQGKPDEPHYGFYFHSGETESSVLAGLTIINACTGNFTHGGGITCYKTSPTIADCTVSDSTAAYGGGIACKVSSPAIVNCTISANSALNGGGISSEYSSPMVLGCVVTGNKARLGGGFYCRKGSPEIINCTFSGNFAAAGSSFYCWRSAETIRSCVVWGNFLPGPFGHYPFINPLYSCLEAWIGGGEGNIAVDPCFVAPGYWADPNDPNIPAEFGDPNAVWVQGDYHLLPDSPCINAGDPQYAHHPNQRDIDNEPRVFDGRVDMGADEFVPVTEVPMKFTPQALGPASKGKWMKAHLVLPDPFTVDDVDTNCPAALKFLGIEINSEHMNLFVNEDGLVEIEIGFDRGVFCGAGSAEGTVTVVGLFTDGRYFRGTDTVKLVNKTFERLAILASHWLWSDCRPPDWCGGLDLDRDSLVNFMDFAAINGCCLEILPSERVKKAD